MRKSGMFSVLLTLLCAAALVADEGMWRPKQLPALKNTLKKLGIQMDPAALADITKYPMNSVISLGGCTASFVSPQGLIITNHHCAYSSIQRNSTKERNLLRDGFLAKTKAEELAPDPLLRVLVTEAVDDVTPRILSSIPAGATGIARYKAIEGSRKILVAECEKDAGYRCTVVSYNGGLEYELIKQLEIRDIRLVHAPAESVGKYGGEIDNWMWPRHTGDYSFFRAYVGPDGKPADYAIGNVPYRPKNYLKVNETGIRQGDFVLAAGYPGATQRYRLATEVEHAFEWRYPAYLKEFKEWIALVEKLTADREDAHIKSASLMAGLNNVAKNFEGMLAGYSRHDLTERKEAIEKDLQLWIQSDPDRRTKFHRAIEDLQRFIQQAQADEQGTFYYHRVEQGSNLLFAARTLYRLSEERRKPDTERDFGFQERDVRRIGQLMTRMSSVYDGEVDRSVLRHFLIKYAKSPGKHVKQLDQWFGISGGTVDEAALDAKLKAMYQGTGLADEGKRLDWMKANPEEFATSADPFIQLAVKLYPYELSAEEKDKELSGRIDEARRRYMQALIAYYQIHGKTLYADANGTLRVTFGAVKGYSPRDAVNYSPFTTLRGILEKNTGKEPFDAPKEELQLIGQRDYAKYSEATLGSVPVNFLTTLDSTGGNSGSPTMNGRGELVGLLFDGNFESIISDWDYLPAVTRAIHVDIRYVLWVMDKVYGAHNLLEEMGINRSSIN